MASAKRLLGQIGLGLLGIIVALMLIEVGLRLFPPDQLNSMVERTSQRLQLYRLDPLIGWVLKSNAQSVHTTREDLVIPIETNSLGLRDNEHAYQKPDGTFRILVIGDSFTEAIDVYLEESFPFIVEQCLKQHLAQPVEVISGGVSGYNTGDEYLFYKNEGVKYSPDLVVLALYIGNDFSGLERTTEERMVTGFGGFRFRLKNGELNQTWISWESPQDGQTSALELVLRRNSLLYRVLAHPESKIYWFFRDLKDNLAPLVQSGMDKGDNRLNWKYYFHASEFYNSPDIPSQTKEIWAVFQAVVSQLKQEVEANEAQLVTAVIPTDYQVSKRARERVTGNILAMHYDEVEAMDWRLDEPNLSILQAMKQQQIPTLDLLPYLLAHEEAGGAPLYFDGFGDEHFNRGGHKLMVDVMCDWLVQNEAIRLPRSVVDGE
jgi:hypothetical protein